jgi:hypothetical protein
LELETCIKGQNACLASMKSAAAFLDSWASYLTLSVPRSAHETMNDIANFLGAVGDSCQDLRTVCGTLIVHWSCGR